MILAILAPLVGPLLGPLVALPAFISGPILGSLGFLGNGVAANSVAAAIQATMGNVAAGSAFAAAQSIGATVGNVAGAILWFL